MQRWYALVRAVAVAASCGLALVVNAVGPIGQIEDVTEVFEHEAAIAIAIYELA